MSVYWSSALLVLCWIAAIATLLIFLESRFGWASRNRLTAGRASGPYGVVSVFLVMRGSRTSLDEIDRGIRGVFGQSYPFIELFLIYSEDNPGHAALAREFQNLHSHVSVRPAAVPTLHTAHDAIRALEQTQPSARGRWYVVLDPGVILDRLAIETSLEFAATQEFSALALRPGLQCRSAIQRLLAPCMEQLSQAVHLIRRRRGTAPQSATRAAYLLVNRDAFDVVNRINRMPGILNEAGWNTWSYQLEGLRTFEGDGSLWMWREVPDRLWAANSAFFVAAFGFLSLVPVAGLVFSLSVTIDTFVEASVAAFSAATYALTGVSHFLIARRLHGAAWSAPLWVLPFIPALILTLRNIRHHAIGETVEHGEFIYKD